MDGYQTHKKNRKTTEKTCQKCGKQFLAKTILAKFCGTACKQQNHLDKKAEKERLSKEKELKEFNEAIEALKILLELELRDGNDVKEITETINDLCNRRRNILNDLNT